MSVPCLLCLVLWLPSPCQSVQSPSITTTESQHSLYEGISILHQTFKLGIKIIMVKCKMSALGSIKCKVPCWDGKDGHWTNDCLLNDQLLLAFSSAHRSWAASQLGGVPHTVWTHRSRFPLISDTEIFSVWATSVTCKGRVWFLNPCHWHLLFPEFFI